MSYAPMTGPLISAGQLPSSPYKGLIPYASEDAPFFFGREVDREVIISNMLAWRLTLLYGASGVGKSSVLNAGVVARLHHQAATNLAEQGSPGLAVVIFNTWQTDPMASLMRAVETGVSQMWEGRQFSALPPTQTPNQLLKAWAERAEGELLVILDQFEEYFLYHEDEDGAGSFFEEFPRLLTEANLPVNFLISIREDALAKLDRFKGRIPGLFNNYLRIDHLDYPAARQTIIRPLDEYNRRIPAGQPPVGIEPGLVEAVLNQVRAGQLSLGETDHEAATQRPGAANGIETPYLQLVLTRLWEQEQADSSNMLRLETLQRAGGAGQIVRTHLDKVMSELSQGEQMTAALMFRHFVAVSGGKFAQSIPDLADLTDLPPTQLEPVLEKLCGSGIRILRPVAPPDGIGPVRYEIFHDVLAAAILDWRRRYTTRLEAEEETRQLVEQQEQREKSLRDRFRRRLTWAGIGLFSLGLAVAIILAVFGFDQARQANTSRNQAEIEANNALTAQADALNQRNTAQAEANRAATQANLAATAQANAVRSQLQAQEQNQAAQQQRDQALALALSLQGQTNLSNQPDLGLLLNLAAVQVTDTQQVHYSLRTALLNTNPALITFLRGHTDALYSVVFRPGGDGKTFASAGKDGQILIWQLGQSKSVQSLKGHTGPINSLAFSPDGRYLISGSADKTVRLWDMTSPNPTGLIISQLYGAVQVVAVSPDGRYVVAGGGDRATRVVDIASRQEVRELVTGNAPIWSLAFSPDGTKLVSGDGECVAKIWNFADRRLTQTLEQPMACSGPGTLFALTFSPDGKELALGGGNNGAIRRFSTSDYTRIGGEFIGKGQIRGLAYGPKGRLYSANTDGSVYIWETGANKTNPPPFTAQHAALNALTISPDGKMLVSASDDTSLVEWRLSDEPPSNGLNTVLSDNTGPIYSLALSPDGKILASNGPQGVVVLWDMDKKVIIKQVRLTSTNVLKVVFSPDGKMLGVGTGEGKVFLLNPTTAEILGEPLTATSGSVVSLTFSPDSKFLAVGSADPKNSGQDISLRLWEVSSRKKLTELAKSSQPFYEATFSPDGKTLVAHDILYVYAFRVADYQPIFRIASPGKLAASLAFSPDGKLLAVGTNKDGDDGIYFLNSVTGQVDGKPMLGHSRGVSALAFSPDGKALASASFDKTVRLWDVEQRQEAALLTSEYNNGVRGLVYSPNGNFVVSGSEDGTVGNNGSSGGKLIISNLSVQTLKEQACQVANRNFSAEEWKSYRGDAAYTEVCPGTFIPGGTPTPVNPTPTATANPTPSNTTAPPTTNPVTTNSATTPAVTTAPPTTAVATTPPVTQQIPTMTSEPLVTTPAILTPPSVQPITSASQTTAAPQTTNAGPSQAEVNLTIPYVNQIKMVAPEFDGNWAVGAADVVMVAAYYKKLTPRRDVYNGIPSPYGWYVSNVFTSPTGAIFDRTDKDASGKPAAGAYGAVTEGGAVYAWRMVDFLKKMGINATFRTSVDQDTIKTYLKAGKPVILANNIKGFGHVVVVKGYTSDGRWICADSYWAQLPTGEIIYKWEDFGGTPYMVTIEDNPPGKS